jgi:hypothetical protein
MDAFVEPPTALTDIGRLLPSYVAAYRRAVAGKLAGLTDADARRVLVPSGWTPIELLTHLAYMERRWLQWGFAGRNIPDPFGDADDNDRWSVPAERTLADALAFLAEVGAASDAVLADAPLDRQAPPGPRFRTDEPTPTLGWILLHVLQEYARHLGHLDIARELLDGVTGA